MLSVSLNKNIFFLHTVLGQEQNITPLTDWQLVIWDRTLIQSLNRAQHVNDTGCVTGLTPPPRVNILGLHTTRLTGGAGTWNVLTTLERSVTLLGCWNIVFNTLLRKTGVGRHETPMHVRRGKTLNIFYLQLYDVRHMVKDHSDSEKGNPLPPHRLLFTINSKGSFICTIPQTG